MGSQQFCLKWNNHQLNMLTVFDQLLQNEAFVDVTIACEGLSLKAHKMVLSACSPYFQNLFMDNPCKHPIVILKDIRYDEMKAIIDFMYKGEVNVSQDQLSALLKTAEALKVKGLAEVTGQGPHGQVQQSNSQSSVLFETVGSRHSPPAKRKKRPPASAPVSIGSPVSPGNSNTSHSTSSHRALSPPHPVVQSAVSLAPVASVGSSATTSGMCSGDEEQTPLMGLNRSRNIEGVPGSSKDSLSNVKEEKIEMEEPPDEVEDLIMEATPEHIEIEPSTTDTGFNGSTQDQSQLANIKYGNMFNPQPSTSGTSPGSMQMTTRSRNVHVTLQSSLNTTTLSNFPSELDHQNKSLRSCEVGLTELTGIRHDFPVPVFSPAVQKALEGGITIHRHIWNDMITQCAIFYKNYGVESPQAYRAIGRNLCYRYPVIKKDGPTPWKVFTKSLSQKIRKLRLLEKTHIMSNLASVPYRDI